MKKETAANGNFHCANDAGSTATGSIATGTAQVNKRGAGGGRGWHCHKGLWRRSGDNRDNHKGRCEAAPTPEAAAGTSASVGPAAAAAAAPRAEGDDDDPEHPCPICLVNEDNHRKYGQCFACGQLYCGDCNGAAPMESCPTCRAPIDVPDEVLVGRLVGLLARSPGRHTPVAQANLAVMYARGTGVAQDDAEAARWLRLAATQGNAMAQCNLGLMCTNGIGVAQDPAEAWQWYRLAADQGHAAAQYNLGVMYETGTGVAQDHAAAVWWYRLAADHGNPAAQAQLGRLVAGARV